MALIDNCIAYYKLDETSGIVADSATGNYDAAIDPDTTLNQSGKIGTSFKINSAGAGHVSVPSLPLAGGSMSFNLWIYSSGTSERHILQAENVTDHAGLAYWSNKYYIYQNSGWATNVTPTTGAWVMVTYTYDHVNHLDTIYENGVQKAQRSKTMTLANQTFEIGGWDGTYNDKVDEVGFWSKCLSSDEIT